MAAAEGFETADLDGLGGEQAVTPVDLLAIPAVCNEQMHTHQHSLQASSGVLECPTNCAGDADEWPVEDEKINASAPQAPVEPVVSKAELQVQAQSTLSG